MNLSLHVVPLKGHNGNKLRDLCKYGKNEVLSLFLAIATYLRLSKYADIYYTNRIIKWLHFEVSS